MSILDVYEWLTDGIGGAVLGGAGTVAKAGVALPGVKDYLAGCKDKLVAGRLLPGNHDLVRGVRTAHICALDHVARRHASALRSLPAHEVGADEHAFADSVRGFLDQRLAVLNQGSMDHDAVTAEDMAHVLGDLIHAATSEGFDACEREARARAEARALQEIEKDAGRPAPPLFARAFAGDGGAGWYDAFALFVTEKLKTEERFRSIFFATELVDIKRAVAALDGRIGQVVASLPDILSFRDAVVASLARIEAIALRIEAKIDQLTGSGVPERPLRAVLRKLDVADIAKEEIPGEFEKAANELVALRAQLRTLSNDGPQFDAIRARALAAIDTGEFDRARTILGEGRNAAREQREQATRIEAEFLVEEARVAKLQRDYPATIEALQAALRLTPDAVWTWIELGDLQTTLGSIAKAKTAYQGALAAARRLNDERDVYVSLMKIGDISVAEGDYNVSLVYYRKGRTITLGLAERTPENAEWQRDVATTNQRIGDILAAKGDRGGALANYREGLAIMRRLAERAPENEEWQRDISVSLERIGKMLAAEGERAVALASYREGLEIMRRLVARTPENADWQHDVSAVLASIGALLTTEGDRAGALAHLSECLKINRSLSSSDPQNAQMHREVAISLGLIGEILLTEGDRAGALANFRETLEATRRLAALEPENALWQRDVSVSLNRIGDMLAAEGDRAGALTSYREGLDIRRRLAARDPENAGWQRDVSVSLNKISDMLAAEGDRAGALTSYREGLEIARRLGARDPENTTWQRDVSVSLTRIGDMLAAEGDRAGALTSYREGLDIRRRLAARDPENAGWQRDVSVSLNRIGDMLAAEGDRAGALTSYREGLEIRRRLAARDPENATWQRDLIVSLYRMAEADPGGGAGHYGEALRIATALRDGGRLAPVDAWIPDDLARRLRAAEGE